MSKILALMILFNVLIGLLFVASSLYIWAEVEQWSGWNIASIWSPIIISAYRIPNTPQVEMPVGPVWNLPFILFWVAVIGNILSAVLIQRRTRATAKE